MAELERSGLPATQFAALAGVRYQTFAFATWLQERREEKAGRQAPLAAQLIQALCGDAPC